MPALRFAERWAEFTKAYAIYPSTNVRVRGTLETLLETLPDALRTVGVGSAEDLEICFFREALYLAGEEIELHEGTGLRWLHDRIHRAALAGVAFGPGLEEDALLAFTERLLELYAKNEPASSFQELWTGSYPGLRLIDRRFRGSFGADRPDTDGRTASWGADGTVVIDTSGDLALADRLGERPEIREALATFEERVAERTEAGEATCEVDILSRILRQMPGDVMEDEERVVRITEAALRRLATRLDDLHGDVGDAIASDAEILQLMFEASQGLLGRSEERGREHLVPEVEHHVDGDGPDRPPKRRSTSASAHARRDAEITDDHAAFLRELAELPPPTTEPLTADRIGDPAEQTGVFLHFLHDDDGEEYHAFAERALVAQLEEASPAEMQVLGQYLATPPDEAEAARRRRLEDVLRRNRVGATLRGRGLITPERVLETFPEAFGLYLESLDPEQAEDRAELETVASSLGVLRIREAREALLGAEHVLEASRLDRLLAAPSRSLLPFYRLALEQGVSSQRQRVVGALRRMYKTQDVACLLFVFDTPEQLPVWYTRALTEPSHRAGFDGAIRAQITQALIGFIRETAGDLRRVDRRVYAIQNLLHFMTSEAVLLLEEILRARTFGIVPREPKHVRQVARQILKQHKAGRKG